jgi:cation:H+ antiporter
MIFFAAIAYDGKILWQEAWIGIVAFLVYSIYLIHESGHPKDSAKESRLPFPVRYLALLVLAGLGIYLGADYTVSSISEIANGLAIPPSIIALTVLSLGTTLPELAVNISAIKQGKAEMAIGNVLGSCIFNMMVVPGAAAIFGPIAVPATLIGFSLPYLVGSGLFFYLLTQDKTLSRWEGILCVLLFVLFILKAAGLA